MIRPTLRDLCDAAEISRIAHGLAHDIDVCTASSAEKANLRAWPVLLLELAERIAGPHEAVVVAFPGRTVPVHVVGGDS